MIIRVLTKSNIKIEYKLRLTTRNFSTCRDDLGHVGVDCVTDGGLDDRLIYFIPSNLDACDQLFPSLRHHFLHLSLHDSPNLLDWIHIR